MTDDVAREHRQGSRDISIWRQRAEVAEREVSRLTAALESAEKAIEGALHNAGYCDCGNPYIDELFWKNIDAAKEAL